MQRKEIIGIFAAITLIVGGIIAHLSGVDAVVSNVFHERTPPNVINAITQLNEFSLIDMAVDRIDDAVSNVFPELPELPPPKVISTIAQLNEFGYPHPPVHYYLRLYTPLEPVGYMATIVGGSVSHHFYIGALEDTYIIIMVALPSSMPVYVERFAIHAEVEGRLALPRNERYFERMRRLLMDEWELTIDEFEELFTPYFIRSRWRQVTIIE